MAKSLMQLTKLEVGDCEEMIEIVASSGNDDARNEIEFKMLKYLELSALPSLRGFYSGTDHTVKFPSLENLWMTGCTQLEGFILDVTTNKNRLGNEIEDIDSARLLQRFLFDNKIRIVLEEIARKIEGTRVEDNRFCISVHYRNVREEDYDILEEKVKAVIETYPEFHLTRGKKVLEVRPSIEWNKGHALEYLLDTLGFSNSGDVLPLYIGDDRTDEDAFKVIEARGQGFPIIVSSTPKETKAAYSLHDPSEVLTFLLRLARWRKASSSSRSLAQIWGLGNSHSHKANC